MRRRLEALAAAHDDSLDPLLVDAAGRLARARLPLRARRTAVAASDRRRASLLVLWTLPDAFLSVV